MSIISIGIPVPDRSALPGQTGGEVVEVNLQYATQNYCADSSNPSPTVATPAGGTFSYAPGGISGGANGQIVIASSAPGNYTVTYTVAGVGSANFPINITALDDASFSYSASAFCADASNQTPTITTPGGTFTTQDITFHPFQMQFEVASGVSKTITIPSTIGSSFTVDWGDGTTTTETGGNISHTYNPGGVGTTENPIVSIGAEGDSGAFTSFQFSNGASSKGDLLDIPQWGSINWSYFGNIFAYCNNPNFQISATDAPNLTNVNGFIYSFYNSTLNSNINHWDVSSIITMSNTFSRAYSFNQDLSSWDVSNVENMQNMFYIASSFNQNLSDWDISSLTTALNMFGATTNLSVANYTDTVVGWAVFVYNNSGSPSSIQWTGTTPSFDGTRTSDLASGQTYAAKYGSNWPSAWTNNNAQDAYDYLTTTLSWSIN